jgi:pimeloyl-ACP methyl ester carboxylesterase
MKKQKRKGRWWRRVLRTFVVLTGLFIIACFIFDHFYQFRKSDEELRQIFRDNHIPATLSYYTSNGRRLRYVSVGNDSLPVLLFLHGSPGSMSYYSWRFKDPEIEGKFRIYAVDRPGYGYSGFGNPEPSIQKQSEMIRPLLDSLNRVRHPVIVVGGSYGSSIACRLAMDHPELVDGLVLTGPSLAPGQEKYFWFTPVIESPLIRWFIPRMLRSANTEKYYHKEELEKMLPLWKNIRVPVMYLQGAKDNIIDTSNATFARKALVNVPYLNIHFFPNREHRLAQFEWQAIKKSILEVYERVK